MSLAGRHQYALANEMVQAYQKALDAPVPPQEPLAPGEAAGAVLEAISAAQEQARLAGLNTAMGPTGMLRPATELTYSPCGAGPKVAAIMQEPQCRDSRSGFAVKDTCLRAGDLGDPDLKASSMAAGVTVRARAALPQKAGLPQKDLYAALAEMQCRLDEVQAKLAHQDTLNVRKRKSRRILTSDEPRTCSTSAGAKTTREQKITRRYNGWVFPAGPLTSAKIRAAGYSLTQLSHGLREEPTQSTIIGKFVTALTKAPGGRHLASLVQAEIRRPHTQLHTLREVISFAGVQAERPTRKGRESRRQVAKKGHQEGDTGGGGSGGQGRVTTEWRAKTDRRAEIERHAKTDRKSHGHGTDRHSHSQTGVSQRDTRGHSASRGTGRVSKPPWRGNASKKR